MLALFTLPCRARMSIERRFTAARETNARIKVGLSKESKREGRRLARGQSVACHVRDMRWRRISNKSHRAAAIIPICREPPLTPAAAEHPAAPHRARGRTTPIFFLLPGGFKGGGATLMVASSSESEAAKWLIGAAIAGRVSSVSTVTDTPPSNCDRRVTGEI